MPLATARTLRIRLVVHMGEQIRAGFNLSYLATPEKHRKPEDDRTPIAQIHDQSSIRQRFEAMGMRVVPAELRARGRCRFGAEVQNFAC